MSGLSKREETTHGARGGAMRREKLYSGDEVISSRHPLYYSTACQEVNCNCDAANASSFRQDCCITDTRWIRFYL